MRSVFSQLSLLLLSLFVVGWLLGSYFQYLELGLLIWAIVALLTTNLPKAKRHLQWALPPLALAWSLTALGLMVWLKSGYQDFLTSHPSLVGWLQQTLGIQMPTDITGMVMLLSALFLGLYVTVKSIYLSGMRYAIHRQYVQNPLWEAAYRRLPAQGWTLIPWWLFARRMCWAAAMIGMVLIALSWLFHARLMEGSWLPLLASALFLLGAELAAWLGGPLGDEWKAELDGVDTAARRQGRFAKVWKAYRETWPAKWLVAGNLAPRLPGQSADK